MTTEAITVRDEAMPEVVRRAMVETVCDIGQLSKSEVYQLNKYVKTRLVEQG